MQPVETALTFLSLYTIHTGFYVGLITFSE